MRDFIKKKELFLFKEEGTIKGMLVFRPYQDKDYEAVNWSRNTPNDRVATIALLGVIPAFQRQGIGKKILKEVILLAKSLRKETIRLDTLKSNATAQRLYEGMGFSKADERTIPIEFLGKIGFIFYERYI